MNRDGWGAVLRGDPAEIEDWKHCLGNMFDPWVEQVDNDVVLRSSSFDNIQTAEELRDVARILNRRSQWGACDRSEHSQGRVWRRHRVQSRSKASHCVCRNGCIRVPGEVPSDCRR